MQKNSLAVPRIDTIDAAKGFGMLFVIFAHLNYTPAPLTVIYSFHMPLYFILSGMMFNQKKYNNFGTFLKRRFQTLIIPYLIFQFISIAFFFLTELIFSGFSSELLKQGSVYITQVFVSQGSANMFNRPMWFVLCLFAVELMYYFISSFNKAAVAIICAVLTAAGWLLESDLINFDNRLLPWSLDSALFTIGFYAIGNIFAQPVKNTIVYIKSKKYKNLICIGIAAVCLAIGIPLALYNGKISLGSKILNNGFLLYITGIIGSIFILSLSIILDKIKALNHFGRVSFSVMGIHYLFRMVVSKIYVILGIEAYNSMSLKECIIPFVAVTVMSAVFAFIYDKTDKHIRMKYVKRK